MTQRHNFYLNMASLKSKKSKTKKSNVSWGMCHFSKSFEIELTFLTHLGAQDGIYNWNLQIGFFFIGYSKDLIPSVHSTVKKQQRKY